MRTVAVVVSFLLACDQGELGPSEVPAPPAPAMTVVPITDPAPVPELPPEPPRCCACAMEDARLRARENPKTITARYLGIVKRSDGDCRRGERRYAMARFALVSDESNWLGSDVTHVRALLSCPELSRPDYTARFGDDGWGTGGSAPILRRGDTYRVSVVESANVKGRELRAEMVAIDPYETTP
jgi:hypothetical protein